MPHCICKVIVIDPYLILVRFDDGLEGTVDLSPLIGQGVFQRLRDPEEFAKVFLDPETHTVAWPGGIDLCPDALDDDIRARSVVE